MKIGDAAKASGLSAKTIRYYESIGLLHSHRLDNGYRDYRERDVIDLKFLHRARELGFSIDSCRSLLALQQNPSRASAAVKRVAEEHLAHIEQQLHQLHQMRDSLQHLVQQCPGDDSTHCAILEGLRDERA